MSQGQQDWEKEDVDTVVKETFFGDKRDRDTNLQFVRDMLTTRSPDKLAGLKIYQEIVQGKRPVLDEEQSLIKSHLKLSLEARKCQNLDERRDDDYNSLLCCTTRCRI